MDENGELHFTTAFLTTVGKGLPKIPDVESRSGAVGTMRLGSVLCGTFSGLEPLPATDFTIVGLCTSRYRMPPARFAMLRNDDDK